MMNSPGFLLFVLTLLPLCVSSRIFFLKTLCTASSRLEHVEFRAVSQMNDMEVAQFNSSSGTVVPSLPWVQKVATQKSSLWRQHNNMLLTSQQLLKNIIRETKNSSHTDVQVLQEIVGCEWDRSTWETNGFLMFWMNAEKPLKFISNSQAWVTPTPEPWSMVKFEAMTEYWVHYLSTVCPELLSTLVLHGKIPPVQAAEDELAMCEGTTGESRVRIDVATVAYCI